jgi:cation transport ATPase
MDDTEKSCEPCEHVADHDDGQVARMELVRIGLVAVAAAGTWFRWWPLAGAVDAAAIAAVVIGGWPIYREAFEALRERRMTMELSMTLAIGAAMGIGEGFTALVIVLFVLIAEVLEGLT